MEILARQRCLNHLNREAVARCPECKRFFCRECVTEHEDRLICAACLKKLAKATARRRVRERATSRGAAAAVVREPSDQTWRPWFVPCLLRAGTARSFGARDVPARSGWESPRGVRVIPGPFVVSRLLRAGTARAPERAT